MWCVSEEPIRHRVESTWTFERNDQRLVLQRRETNGTLVLVVIDEGSSRSIPFRDESALITFQSDMEQFLVRTGWTFIQFSPDRRRADRRTFPRITSDRRRWWTDASPRRQR
jgi:hypothetical protein